jgi:hypothetical protein
MFIFAKRFFMANLVVVFIRRACGGATSSFSVIGLTFVLDLSRGRCCGPLSIRWMVFHLTNNRLVPESFTEWAIGLVRETTLANMV